PGNPAGEARVIGIGPYRKFFHGCDDGARSLPLQVTRCHVCSKVRSARGGMANTKTLYDEDIVAWSKQQADALRAAARSGSNLQLDWENLAEEVEDLAKSYRLSLKSHLRRIVQHLVKLQH